ncbi:MAG: RNA polymerase sigma factor [Bdellovibrionales bacterium]|nr:RNA polymerase sigma factor [Bdellovibrionales bacterium]
MKHEQKPTVINEQPDEELMVAYQRGYEQAFEILYERYSKRIYGYLCAKLKDRSLIDDVFQMVFLKLHRFRDRYRANYPFAPWMFTLCHNTMIDAIRAQGRILEDSDMTERSAENALELSTQAVPDLAALTPERREALKLRYGEDLSFDEMAKRLGTTSENARQLISRALRQLRKISRSKGDL